MKLIPPIELRAFRKQPTDYIIPPEARRPAAREIIKETLTKYNVTVAEFYAKKRAEGAVLEAMREICKRLRNEHNYSTYLIGKCVSRDHASVWVHISGYKRPRYRQANGTDSNQCE